VCIRIILNQLKSCWRYQKSTLRKSVCSNPILSFAIRKKTPEIVERLSEICPVWVTNIITIEDNFQIISDFGQLFNCRTEAQKWNDKLALWMILKLHQRQTPKKVAYFIWKNPYMVAGSDNFINELLKLNHFKNIYDNELQDVIQRLN
jgi:ABC-type Fe3+-hydroxamate transport system substrate-binding protein